MDELGYFTIPIDKNNEERKYIYWTQNPFPSVECNDKVKSASISIPLQIIWISLLSNRISFILKGMGTVKKLWPVLPIALFGTSNKIAR